MTAEDDTIRSVLIAADDSARGLVANGRWVAANAATIEHALDDALVGVAGHGSSPFDLAGITELDTFGAALIGRTIAMARERGIELQAKALPGRFADLVEAYGRARPVSTPIAPKSPRLAVALADIQTWCRYALDAAERIVSLLGAAADTLVGFVTRPKGFRPASVVHQLDRAAWQALPIILLITFLIGGIIAQQGFFHFRKFGADQYVVDMVGILVLREIGVLIVSIMVAGRSGSSFTAELGSMKMREEIDALRTMGVDPYAVLILPRLLALLIGLPILSFVGAMSALLGGGVVAWAYGDMAPAIYIVRLKEAISLTHFEVGMIKSPFMALAIGIVACAKGLAVRGSAESLGLATTASVVTSIFLVIVLDGLFAMYFAAMGM